MCNRCMGGWAGLQWLHVHRACVSGAGDHPPTPRPAPPQVTASYDSDDATAALRTLGGGARQARTAVIAYTASFFSGMPFQVLPTWLAGCLPAWLPGWLFTPGGGGGGGGRRAGWVGGWVGGQCHAGDTQRSARNDHARCPLSNLLLLFPMFSPQDPVVVLMKEYLPGAKAIACNEMQVLKHLAGMPEQTMKWQVRARGGGARACVGGWGISASHGWL